MNFYFEKLTLVNLAYAFVVSLRGHKVFYFETSRLIKKLPVLTWVINSRFYEADRRTAEPSGFGLKIDDVSLDFVENCTQQIVHDNRLIISLWRKAFGTDLIVLFIKKSLATGAWSSARNFLLLHRLSQENGKSVRLVVSDNPQSRLLVRYFSDQFPESSVKMSGLSRLPWRVLQSIPLAVLAIAELWARLLWRIGRSGVTYRSYRKPFRICREVVWGIGTGRRTDDFMVDGEIIRPEEMLFYQRRSSSRRMSDQPGVLKTTLDAAKDKGYTCVGFDDPPITLSMLFGGFLYRYLALPFILFSLTIGKQTFTSSSSLLHGLLMLFLIRTMRWEIFLSTYAPSLHLGPGETHPGHIADTVGMNLHGCQAAGYQWADMTQWRSVQSAYVGLNVYFAWGAMQEKFWEGNWEVDRIVHSGYTWGHYYQESLQNRENSRNTLLGESAGNAPVIALFDESPNPNWNLSEAMIRDFYAVGIRLLENRPDVIIVAKTKRYGGIKNISSIIEMVQPHLDSGRFKLWDNSTLDLWEALAVSDVAISIGAPYLEAVACGMPGFNFGPWRKDYSSPIYDRGHDKIAFNDVDKLVSAIETVLDDPNNNPWAGIEDLLDEADPYRDFQGINRWRQLMHEITEGTIKK